MIIQPLFETERLLVRHFGPDDLDDFAALCADSEVMRYVGDGETLPCGEVARWIEICQTKYETRVGYLGFTWFLGSNKPAPNLDNQPKGDPGGFGG